MDGCFNNTRSKRAQAIDRFPKFDPRTGIQLNSIQTFKRQLDTSFSHTLKKKTKKVFGHLLLTVSLYRLSNGAVPAKFLSLLE